MVYLKRLNSPSNELVKNGYFDLELEGKKEKKKWDGYYKINGRFYPRQDNYSMLSISELYLKRKMGDSELTIGRKLLNWNPDEKFWGLGVINGNRGFSYMDFQQEGVNGLHFERKVSRFYFSVFAGAIHYPQMNPSFKIKNKKVTATNEWSALPFKEVSFRGTSIPISNQLIRPNNKDIIFNGSFGVRTSYLFGSGKVQLFGMYKPENLLRVVATGSYNPEDEIADVKASAFVNHHLVWGGNLSKKVMKSTLIRGGFFVDHPMVGEHDFFEFEAMKIVPTYVKRTYAHGSIHFGQDIYQLSFNYLHNFEPERDEKNILGQRPMWEQAIGVKGSYFIKSGFELKAFFKYDLKLRDSLMALGLNYRFSKHASMRLGLESVDSPGKYSFWSPFKTNDSLISGVSYSF